MDPANSLSYIFKLGYFKPPVKGNSGQLTYIFITQKLALIHAEGSPSFCV